MGRKNRKSAFHLPTRAELAVYNDSNDPRDGPSINPGDCKARPFKFDPTQEVTTAWNSRCIEIFVEFFCRTEKLGDKTPWPAEKVKKAIVTHHKALKRQWQVLNHSELSESGAEKLAMGAIRQEKYSRRKDVGS